ncbi:serine/threonine-protein phosphatase 2A activator-like isoform X1 [Mizuhopecten yessoensis]|uniref:serine/threonine-protein phosphatase 2A activator-like isoform X1 n=1 Tax=Mizuhopecten yessoensis TaxID=6573 RepID=UPI000B45C3EB|nr:serine/threonine-protein phosphatase 2A activator-like isoform X1 [Mizuhopecten yessoensis]
MADADKTDEPPVQEELKEEVPAKTEDRQSDTFDIKSHTFEIPNKKVSLPTDVPAWEASEAYKDIVGFICAVSEAVKSKKIRDSYSISETTTRLVNLLDTMSQWVDEIPPIDQPQRFGNKAFKDFYDRLKDRSETLLKDVLDEKFHAAIPEIAVYLQEGIGNGTRIDYGTGHELSFVAFLCCLFKIGALQEEDAVPVALQVFQR